MVLLMVCCSADKKVEKRDLSANSMELSSVLYSDQLPDEKKVEVTALQMAYYWAVKTVESTALYWADS